jgi:hypothetical protein
VAAALNAANPEVGYVYTIDEVVGMFQAAFDSGDFETTKDLFAAANEVCCPLDDQVIPDWTNVSFSPFDNINEEGIDNPVLTATDVTDVEEASFVADPFLFYENGTWYMFFEVGKWNGWTHWGDIGLAKSTDGLNWTYDQIVLEETTHHSYPLVIKYKCRYYMITESWRQRQIRFYEARNFPYEWERVYTITKCGDVPDVFPGQCIDTPNSAIGYLDPSVFRYNDKWWMFGGAGANSDLYLYYSDELLGGWTEHPLNPIIPGDRSEARPGGRAFVFDGDRVIRLAQKCDEPGRYGQRVRAFEVTRLTEYEYEDHEVTGGAPFCTDGGVFCESGGAGSCAATIPCPDRDPVWNLCGMHNFDAWWTGDRWLIVTDGYKCIGQTPTFVDDWSIGIYVSEPLASAAE